MTRFAILRMSIPSQLKIIDPAFYERGLISSLEESLFDNPIIFPPTDKIEELESIVRGRAARHFDRTSRIVWTIVEFELKSNNIK